MAKIDFILDKFSDKIYNKEKSSNLYKILSSLSSELDVFITKLDEVKNAKFVDYAKGNDLDRIGNIVNVIRFRNENDATYRGRIKGKVPTFIGGGTVTAIKEVVHSFLGVEPIVVEHFKEGEGHPVFINGVMNGLSINNSNLELNISAGVWYINGKRNITDDITLDLPLNSTIYIVADNDNNIFIKDELNTADEILLYTIYTNETDVITTVNNMYILDPFNDSITNEASITVQIPYDFDESNISLEDARNVIKETRAAGIAMLIKVIGIYNETITVRDRISFAFMVGFSLLGSTNFIGGYPEFDLGEEDVDGLGLTFTELNGGFIDE